MLSQKSAMDLVHDLMPLYRAERAHLDWVDKWHRWDHDDVKAPAGASVELQRLIELSKTPWLSLVVTTIAQAMAVDGYRSPESADNAGPWKTWQANDLDAGQTLIHRAALAFGYSFAVVSPGVDSAGRRSVIRGVSPRRMYAVYQDPAWDEWPMYSIEVQPSNKGWMVTLRDEEAAYFIGYESADGEPTFIEWREHGAGVCPVGRYALLDLDGRADGQVKPFIGVASRLDKTMYDRLMVQHNNSWRVITATGMAAPDNVEEANRAKLKLRQDSMLIAEDPDSKFGSLPETPLDGFINSAKFDIESLAAVSQTPSHNLTGAMINLSPEALAAARAPLTQKIAEHQRAFGKTHARVLRLAAHLEGDEAAADDVMARVTWQDMEIRSMAQAADALGKIATMLHVPVTELWGRIPGVTNTDVREWKAAAERSDPLAQMTEMLNEQAKGL